MRVSSYVWIPLGVAAGAWGAFRYFPTHTAIALLGVGVSVGILVMTLLSPLDRR